MTRETRIAYLEADAAERLDRIGGCVEEIRNRLRDAHAGTGRADELLARVIDLLEEAVDELSSAEPVTPERPEAAR